MTHIRSGKRSKFASGGEIGASYAATVELLWLLWRTFDGDLRARALPEGSHLRQSRPMSMATPFRWSMKVCARTVTGAT